MHLITMYLITGANGFLGRILRAGLSGPVATLGRRDATYALDLATAVPAFEQAFDLVIHAAGKAHSVPRSAEEAEAFFAVNLRGTEHLLTGLEQAPRLPRALVFISTVAVYGLERGTLLTEAHPLAGSSPYARSKVEAETLVQDWGAARGVTVGVLRLPLVAGPNPPGNLGAMIAGLKTGRYLRIGRGDTRRSTVLAADLAPVLPALAERGGVYNLTDGYHPSFAELEAAICAQLGRPLPRALPLPLARTLARAGDRLGPRAPLNSERLAKLTEDLTFDDTKARERLGWRPRRVLDFLEVA